MSLPIFLIGARGCGKTTVGEALSRALGYAFT
ncbi:MAG TPA: shikimate kinase II, partial [Pantoea agglomerans]|nr:shikimate kinase II [Pantoea agglomerans]